MTEIKPYDQFDDYTLRIHAHAGDICAQVEADARGFSPSWWTGPLEEWYEN